MKKILHTLKKHWITVWLIVAVVGAVSFFVFAEYIEDSNRAKRVVANTAGAGDLFSSDLLAVGGVSDHDVPFGDSDEVNTVPYYELPVRIWNYDSSNPTFYYDDSDITYSLTAQLVKKNASGTYDVITDPTALTDPDGNQETNDAISIGLKKDETDSAYTMFTSTPSGDSTSVAFGTATPPDSYTISQSYDAVNGYRIIYTGLKLFKGGRDENKIYIQFPKWMRTSDDKIYVKLTASPTPSLAAYNGLHDLSGVLSITEGKTELSQGWSGQFNDSTNADDYDGFNYVISGNGEATITFKWRDDKFEINPFFISSNAADIKTVNANGATIADQKIGSETDASNIVWKVITIEADSDVTSRYDIQLYMKNGSANIYAWSGEHDVHKYVQCTAA